MKKSIVVLALLVCVNCASADLVTLLSGYWKMDGDLTDSSVSGVDLTTSYSPVFDGTDTVNNSTHSLSTTEDPGSGGGGARGSAVDTAINSTYGLSMSCWFKWDANPSGAVSYISKWGGTAAHTKYFNLYSWDSSAMYLNLGNSHNYSQEIGVTGLTINLGSWYHLAVSVDIYAAQNEVVKMYLTEEGSPSVQLIKASAWAPSDGAGGTSQIMNYYNDAWFNILPSWQTFTGNADEFRLYRQRALTTEEIQDIYDLEVIPEPATMVILAMGSAFVGLRRRKRS